MARRYEDSKHRDTVHEEGQRGRGRDRPCGPGSLVSYQSATLHRTLMQMVTCCPGALRGEVNINHWNTSLFQNKSRE